MKRTLLPLALFLWMVSPINSSALPVNNACDTAINFSAHDTATYYIYGVGQGYVSGNNIFGDLAKAEELTAPVGSQLTGSFFGFSYVTINPGDSNQSVTINAWDDTGPGGSPGNIIATASVTLAEIAQAVTASQQARTVVSAYIPFNSPALLGDTNFFIGINLPFTTGDTVVLYTTTLHSNDGDGWEESYYGNWATYYMDVAIPHLGNYIAGVACTQPPAANFHGIPVTGCGLVSVNFFDESANGRAAWNWTFTGGNPGSSPDENPIIVYAQPGTYPVKLVVTNAAGSDSLTLDNYVTVYPLPNDSIINLTPATSDTSANGAITISGYNSNGPYQFAWSNGDSSAALSALLPGVYSLTITDANGCRNLNDSVVIPVAIPSGIANITSYNLNIYPNPASDKLHISGFENTTVEIAVLDLTGKYIKQFETSTGSSIDIDLHDLAAGSYAILVSDKQSGLRKVAIFSKQ